MVDSYEVGNPASVQNFPVEISSEDGDNLYQYIQLRVLSNHGNPNYTCLYRFQVHGEVFAQ